MNYNEDDNEYDESHAVTNVSATQLAALKKLGQAAASVVAAHPGASTEPLLRMLKGNGAWVYGVDGTEVEPESEWAINPFACGHGWIAWNRDPKAPTRKLGERMVPITQAMPELLDMPDVGGEWSEQFGLAVRCMSGEDTGLQLLFKTNSGGGKEACLDIIGKIGQRATEGKLNIVPILQLGFSTYNHPSYGLTYKPQFRILRWISMDDAEDGGPEPKAKPEPKTPPKPAAAKPAAKEPETRRRRA